VLRLGPRAGCKPVVTSLALCGSIPTTRTLPKYKVTLRCVGKIVFEVEATDPETAEEAAYDLFDRGFGREEIHDADNAKVEEIT
jgi:hypothetical protein